jgi:hypothetical protein
MVYKLMTRLRAGARRWLELAVVATTRDRRLLPVGANAPTPQPPPTPEPATMFTLTTMFNLFTSFRMMILGRVR